MGLEWVTARGHQQENTGEQEPGANESSDTPDPELKEVSEEHRAQSVRASSAPGPHVRTEDDPDPVQQQQKNPQALSNTNEAQYTTAKLITESKQKINTVSPSTKPKNLQCITECHDAGE